MGIGTGALEKEKAKVVGLWVRAEGMVTRRLVWTVKGAVVLEALMELVGIGGGEGRDRLRTGDGEGEVFRLDRVVTAKRVLVCVLSESAVLPLGVGTTTGRAGLAKYLLDAWRGVVIPSEFCPSPVPTMCP
ncbi:hypothetical protein M0802_015867 [Mischocyttarus mexicanus]|nr:hypothetical protein M0802_015867 [Mischocyttarus mexicanus]